MLTAVCAVVNGGELMQPYVVAKITAPDGTVVKEVQPTVKRRVISEETSATMCRLMEGVVTGGTGKQGARIAGFVSVAPIDDPKVAVLVCLDEPTAGRRAAARSPGRCAPRYWERCCRIWGWRGKAANKDSRARADMESAPTLNRESAG